MPKKAKPSYTEELGVRADIKTVREVSDEIVSSWHFREIPPQNPVLLYLGGFQGSGKTTTLGILEQSVDLAIISPDQIRQILFDRDWKRGKEFTHTVNATRNNLIRRALSLGHHAVIDEMSTQERIKLVKNILRESSSRYTLKTVFLTAEAQTLRKRVLERKGHEGRYIGTVHELTASLRQHSKELYQLRNYDLVLNSEEMTPEQIAKQLRTLLVSS